MEFSKMKGNPTWQKNKTRPETLKHCAAFSLEHVHCLLWLQLLIFACNTKTTWKDDDTEQNQSKNTSQSFGIVTLCTGQSKANRYDSKPYCSYVVHVIPDVAKHAASPSRCSGTRQLQHSVIVRSYTTIATTKSFTRFVSIFNLHHKRRCTCSTAALLMMLLAL